MTAMFWRSSPIARHLTGNAGAVHSQYEDHPYPLVSPLAMPNTVAAHPLSYSLGEYLRCGVAPRNPKPRVLVAGGGAFEPLVVARAHPGSEIVAVDLSFASLKRLRRHAWFAGARIELVQADLHDDLVSRLGRFDYIVCTGVIHHTLEPGRLLSRLTAMLEKKGVLRLMTYAAQSRLWVREAARHLAARGLTSGGNRLRSRARDTIRELPPRHPARAAFETYGDTRNAAGLVDGFFHACEEPIPVPRLRALAEGVGLRLIGLGHAWHSQPRALLAALGHSELAEAYRALDCWDALSVFDDLGELAVNPVLWLSKEPEPVDVGLPRSFRRNPLLENLPDHRYAPSLLAPSPLRFADAARDPAPLFEAAWLLGTDGRLPPALARDRVLNASRATAPADFPGSDTPAPRRLLLGARRAAARLAPGREAEALASLEPLLLPRADARGNDLPWLSSGDWLRALTRRGRSWSELASAPLEDLFSDDQPLDL
jgi:SAM-dependent methyltransferase